jgi:hypothetical protein
MLLGMFAGFEESGKFSDVEFGDRDGGPSVLYQELLGGNGCNSLRRRWHARCLIDLVIF